MTIEEFDREFDILYNNIMSNAAPSIDQYEKSVFLTKAQEDVVVALYNGTFEGSEQLTESLKTLIKSRSTSPDLIPQWKSELLSHNSKLISFPEDVLFIVYESILPYKEGDKIDNLENPKEIEVNPVKHDYYSRIKNNPFKGASKRRAIRVTSKLSVSKKGESEFKNMEVLEVIAPCDLFVYKIRYIRKPQPIILYDSTPGLTINGRYSKTKCELPEMLHRTILDTAVKLAALAYKQ